ncbi:hypothetical protein TWF694_007806 [Orbilia ellipsospora]|uniref:Nuclease S1 n=1 Tax=Orbilia ellipsospora TaxID=2528407 RepID=A0AAV9XIT8_9PEZI
MKTAAVLAFSASLFAQGAYSWGAMGHATVAYIASNYMNGAAKTFVSHILDGATPASVASWADTYRYTAAGRFSAGFHYIDAHDTVPHSCNIDLERDCGAEGCVVYAIANYTERVQMTNLTAIERTDALKFIIHFLGDITQPLHTENLDVGGNDITVQWGEGSKSKTNLHAIWDRQIPETLAGGSTDAVAEKFAKAIVKDIESGIYKDQKDSWVSCDSITKGAACPKVWAADANSFVCTVVLPNGVDAVQGTDLSTEYYEKAAPIARQQLAKGGYRLGMWLNSIAAAVNSR